MVTTFPVRPFVLPFLQANIPRLRDELQRYSSILISRYTFNTSELALSCEPLLPISLLPPHLTGLRLRAAEILCRHLILIRWKLLADTCLIFIASLATCVRPNISAALGWLACSRLLPLAAEMYYLVPQISLRSNDVRYCLVCKVECNYCCYITPSVSVALCLQI